MANVPMTTRCQRSSALRFRLLKANARSKQSHNQRSRRNARQQLEVRVNEHEPALVIDRVSAPRPVRA